MFQYLVQAVAVDELLLGQANLQNNKNNKIATLIQKHYCAPTNFPVFSFHCPSTLPVTLKAQHEPHWPWEETDKEKK